MTRDELNKLAEKYRAKADHAYNVYQETGIARYDRERRNAEDMADAFGMAANAADDHDLLLTLKSQMLWFAHNAEALLDRKDPERMAALLKDIVNFAAAVCKYQKRTED